MDLTYEKMLEVRPGTKAVINIGCSLSEEVIRTLDANHLAAFCIPELKHIYP